VHTADTQLSRHCWFVALCLCDTRVPSAACARQPHPFSFRFSFLFFLTYFPLPAPDIMIPQMTPKFRCTIHHLRQVHHSLTYLLYGTLIAASATAIAIVTDRHCHRQHRHRPATATARHSHCHRPAVPAIAIAITTSSATATAPPSSHCHPRPAAATVPPSRLLISRTRLGTTVLTDSKTWAHPQRTWRLLRPRRATEDNPLSRTARRGSCGGLASTSGLEHDGDEPVDGARGSYALGSADGGGTDDAGVQWWGLKGLRQRRRRGCRASDTPRRRRAMAEARHREEMA
jgi:hypothetical protein